MKERDIEAIWNSLVFSYNVKSEEMNKKSYKKYGSTRMEQ